MNCFGGASGTVERGAEERQQVVGADGEASTGPGLGAEKDKADAGGAAVEGGAAGGLGTSEWCRDAGELDVVAAHFRGMLNLTDEVTDDWAFLKDFLGLKPPHIRDSETGELTTLRPHAQSTLAAPTVQVVPQLTPPSPSPSVRPPQGLLPSPLPVASPVPPASTPLPSISTLVRYTPASSPCVSSVGSESLSGPAPHLAPPLTPEDGRRSLDTLPDPHQFSDSDSCCVVPSEGSAFRSVAPSPGDLQDVKPSPSLLRDLLVLGKPPRSQHDQVNTLASAKHVLGLTVQPVVPPDDPAPPLPPAAPHDPRHEAHYKVT